MSLIKPVSRHGGSRCVVIDRVLLSLVGIDPEQPLVLRMGPGACFRLRAPTANERGTTPLVNHGHAKALSVPPEDFNSVGIDPFGRAEILVEGRDLVLRCPPEDLPVMELHGELTHVG